MAGIFSRLIDFMEEEGWKYEIIEGETVLRFHFKASSGRFHFYANVEEEKNWLIFYSYLPVNTPPEKIHSMAEFITRANRGMPIGNFELDFEDGEIRYKTSIEIEGGPESEEGTAASLLEDDDFDDFSAGEYHPEGDQDDDEDEDKPRLG